MPQLPTVRDHSRPTRSTRDFHAAIREHETHRVVRPGFNRNALLFVGPAVKMGNKIMHPSRQIDLHRSFTTGFAVDRNLSAHWFTRDLDWPINERECLSSNLTTRNVYGIMDFPIASADQQRIFASRQTAQFHRSNAVANNLTILAAQADLRSDRV